VEAVSNPPDFVAFVRFVVRKCFVARCIHNEPLLQDFANGLVRVVIEKNILRIYGNKRKFKEFQDTAGETDR
jgi:hypothetical protein